MGLLDWVRGRPHGTQADRVDARSGGVETVPGEAADLAAAQTPEDVETSTAVERDEEAARRQGI